LLPPTAKIHLKWPNDLLLGDRKLGGILVQARWQGETLGWMVAGVGINVRNEIPDSVSHPATRLDDVGAGLSLEPMAESAALAVAEATRDAGPLSAQELKAFADRDWMRGREIAMPVVGVALGITPDGQLRVQCRDGSVIGVTGSVTLAGQEA
jgi:BirA family biotin operon repressor/biotin-[acetyl-CoA-carboxylase] ligase